MKSLSLKWIALKIEYHWWRIRALRNQTQTESSAYHLGLHRYKADQLRNLYEVTAGIRDFEHAVIFKG